ncbi:MAG: putative Ig domain-containing protein, partial [Ginsengibacter sp.]
MNESCKIKWKSGLIFISIFILGISNIMAQPADSRPIIKYVINNYSSIAKAVCDTCPLIVGKPLTKNRPIPFPSVAAINAIAGFDINTVPGIVAPNFLGGGSPEIEGLVKKVAGMTDTYAQRLRKDDKLYFKTGAHGVAVSKSGQIYTSSGTILPKVKFDDQNLVHGFFSFKSSPERLPVFNSTSEQVFEQSPDDIMVGDIEYINQDKEIAHFALDPNNEKIIYAALQSTEKQTKILARKNPDNGNWEELDWDIKGGLGDGVWGALTVDYHGNLYVADPVRHIIVKVTFDNAGKAKSWEIIGGKLNTPGFVNDVTEDARFNKPSGICVDKAGNIYIADAGNNVIRKIDEDGEVTTYAGDKNGKAGFRDDHSWYDARFDGPTAVAYNEVTKTLYVVDSNNKTIREINDDRDVSTLAGIAGSVNPISNPGGFAMSVYFILAQLNMDPDEAKFDNPTGIAIDPSGLGVYVSDGNYIKYVNTFKAVFTVTSSIRLPGSKTNLYGLPVLPPGIFMNPNNGAFFGVPVMEWEPTTYTISVTNHLGTSLLNGFISFEVVDCPSVPDTVISNKTISPKQLPFPWNGKLFNSGGTQNITLKSSHGCDSVVVMNLSVNGEFHYNCEPYIFSLGQEISPILPITSGSKIDTFSVSPALPEGLILNSKTGQISGTPLKYTTTGLGPAIGPKTPNVYAAPWVLDANMGADISQVKIVDCNLDPIFENNSGFKSLVGSAGVGTGTPGAYTDFSGLGAIKMSTNTPYSVQLSNTLSSQSVQSLNAGLALLNFKNSFAVYIDYNRDGDFADAGERVYISAAPQRDAHTEIFNLNIPGNATPGVTKMRIYCVEAKTIPTYYYFKDGTGVRSVRRTTEQALSFYPFWNDITDISTEQAFHSWINYGEFEDYNIDIVNPSAKAYVITGSNSIGSAESSIKIAVNNPSASTTNATICSTELPYTWNGLTFSQAGSQTGHLLNVFGADSAVTLNLTVKQASSFINPVAYCGPYTYNGVVYTNSGDYTVHLTNAVGCDSSVILRFRQKATSSITNVAVMPGQLPYKWNDVTLTGAGSKTVKLINAEGCDSNATINLRVLYNIYYSTNNMLEINKAITPLKPQIEGNYPLGIWYNSYYGYTISPALPNGLVLDPITGVISGTPTQLSPLKTYTITLNQDGAKPTSFTLSIGIPTASTTTIDNCGPYTWNGVVYSNPTTAAVTLVNQYGFDSTATLVLAIRNPSVSFTNLFVNQTDLPVTWNGITISKESSKIIYLVNAIGCDSAATVNVVVGPKISYPSPQILRPNQPIVAISPQNLGGNIASRIGNVSTLIKNNYLTPLSIAIDRQDNSYLSDSLNGKIYKITRSGVISAVGDFDSVQAMLAIDEAGNMYVADRLSNRILKKDNSGNISILANASSPNGIAVDAAGNVYFSEGRYHRIRKISTSGVVSTLAGGTIAGFAEGNGTTAKFNTPSGLSIDSTGNLYVADLLNNRIRKVSAAGEVTTLAGTGSQNSIDGPGNTAGFNKPIAVANDALGNIYVVDNGSSKIRKINTQGKVSTLAGTTAGYQDGVATQAKFNLPMAIAADQHGNIYLADKANGAIRQINSINYAISPSLITGLHFDEITGIISGTPAETLLRPVTHTVYAFNKAGADSTKLVIAICNPAATSFAVDTCNMYRWNDSTYSSSTTHTRYFKNQGGCDSSSTMNLIIRKGSVGATTTATACGNYEWKGTTYYESGLYTKEYPNAVGCDSVLTLNLTIKPLSVTNLFVDITTNQLPYTWRGKIFTVPGTQSLVFPNSVGCDSTVSMTVRISNLLPNISYAVNDTTLYWERKIEVPIAMTNTGTPIPTTKIGERDTLINFSNGPGDQIKMIKSPNGAYYARVFGSNNIFRLTNTGEWTVFAQFGGPVNAMAMDKSGNLYIGISETRYEVRKITDEGVVSTLPGFSTFSGIQALAVDIGNNLIIYTQLSQNQIRLTRLNLSNNQSVQTDMDNPYFDYWPEDMKTDSKGNIYMYRNSGNNVVKIRPNGRISGIGQKGSPYYQFKPGNGTDALIPAISSMAIDSSNDNIYLMAYGRILRVDTSENVSAVTDSWFDQSKDQIFKVENGKISIINNSTGILYTANVYGVGSIPFMDNYGVNGINRGTVIFKDFDKRIRLDSSGAIVGTPRAKYSSTGTIYATNTSTAYTILAANHYGISSTSMAITTKSISYKMESFVTNSFPFIWRGRSFTAPSDTATYFVTNKTLANDT